MKYLITILFAFFLAGCSADDPPEESKESSLPRAEQLSLLQTAEAYFNRAAAHISQECSGGRADLREECYKTWIASSRLSHESIFRFIDIGVYEKRFDKNWAEVWKKRQKGMPLRTCLEKARGSEQILVCYLREEAYLTAWSEFHDNGRYIGELAADPDYLKSSTDKLRAMEQKPPSEEDEGDREMSPEELEREARK